MPVLSFVRGLRSDGADPTVHATDPDGGRSVCGGLPLDLDPDGRSFTPWADGTCDRCSAALHPRHDPTPPDAHHRDDEEGLGGRIL